MSQHSHLPAVSFLDIHSPLAPFVRAAAQSATNPTQCTPPYSTHTLLNRFSKGGSGQKPEISSNGIDLELHMFLFDATARSQCSTFGSICFG